MIDVDVYKDDKCFMEWSYGKVCGHSLMGNMSFWAEQALLQAQDEWKEQNK